MRLGLAEAYRHQVELRADRDALSLGAMALEQAEAPRDHPEVGAVGSLGSLGGWRAAVVRPALGQDSTAVPHAITQVEIAETREVAGAAVAVAGADEVARVVEARGRGPHADRVEELALHELAHSVLAAADRVADQP